jgi:metal-responsive CopG/Arc/MetJ family transcriptional regulator
VKTAISIPDAVFAAAEHLAQRQGMSRSKLDVRAIAKYVEAHEAEQITGRLNTLYDNEPSSVDSAALAIQARSLPHENR